MARLSQHKTILPAAAAADVPQMWDRTVHVINAIKNGPNNVPNQNAAMWYNLGRALVAMQNKCAEYGYRKIVSVT
eukprot:6207418-Pleurochrysis_carterae.AAC.3